jgi:hypothetical protein
VSAYTLLQLLEVVVASAVLLTGVVTRLSTIAIIGGGFLIGKAVLNILAPEGGTVYRRSLIGYALGAIFAIVGVVAVHFAG